MKWTLPLLALPLLLSACGSQDTGESRVSSYGSCVAPSDSRDPFENYGKVQLDASGGEASQKSAKTKSTSLSEAQAIRAGDEITVTLKGSCELSGPISSELRSRSSSQEAQLGSTRSFTLEVDRDMTLRELRELADKDECVLGISESTKVFAFAEGEFATSESEFVTSEGEFVTIEGTNVDPLTSEQGHLLMLGANKILNSLLSLTGRPVVVAVIDTGIDASHDEFKDILWENPNEIADNGVDDDENGYIDDRNGYNFADDIPSPQYSGDWYGYQHGTHVAGLAVARGFNGIGGQGVLASGAKLMALNVFGNEAGALSANVANAIRYAADNGASVINMSVGGLGRNPVYESAILYAVKKGAVVVAAVGNEAREMSEDYFLAPAAYAPKVRGFISVGSVDSKTGSYSSFSNFSSSYVEIAAPGAESAVEGDGKLGLLSTWPNGEYKRLQGTSMASPITSGAAALTLGLLRSRGYQPSPGTIEDILRFSAYSIRRMSEKVSEGHSLNLERLVLYLDQYYPAGGRGDPGLRGVKNCETSGNL